MQNGIMTIIKTNRMTINLFVSKYMSSYLGTYTYSLLSVLSMFVMTGIFAKYWAIDEFLKFTTTLRYLSVIVVISSFSLGFSIIKKATCFSLKKEIFPTVFFFVSVSSLILGAVGESLLDTPFGLSIWVLSVSIFHVFVSTIRAENPKEANYISINIKVILLLLVVFLMLILKIPLFGYFYIYGTLSLFYIIWISIGREYKFIIPKNSSKVAIKLYRHSFSRAIDNLARIVYHLAPVLIAHLLLGKKAAGLIVLSFIATKSFESSIQPVVLHIHSSRVKNNTYLNINKIVIVFLIGILLAAIISMLLYYVGATLISMWLTVDYISVINYMIITVWAIPCILSLYLMKAELESRLNYSPFVFVNIFAILVFLVLSMLYADSVESILFIYIGVYIVRLIIAIYIYHLEENKEKAIF